MPRRSRCLAVACLLAVAAACTQAGEPPAVTDAFRKEFLKNFKRTWLNTTPEDAMLLRILVEARNAQRGVEVGSATGYGALNMGIGFERTGGHLFTLEIDPEMVKACRANIAKMGLQKTVTCVQGDALKTIPTLEGPIDFVFIDALKSDYLKYLKALEPKLKKGAVIAADNTIRYAASMRDFLDYLAASPDYEMVTIRASDEKRDGMTIAYKLR